MQLHTQNKVKGGSRGSLLIGRRWQCVNNIPSDGWLVRSCQRLVLKNCSLSGNFEMPMAGGCPFWTYVCTIVCFCRCKYFHSACYSMENTIPIEWSVSFFAGRKANLTNHYKALKCWSTWWAYKAILWYAPVCPTNLWRIQHQKPRRNTLFNAEWKWNWKTRIYVVKVSNRFTAAIISRYGIKHLGLLGTVVTPEIVK